MLQVHLIYLTESLFTVSGVYYPHMSTIKGIKLVLKVFLKWIMIINMIDSPTGQIQLHHLSIFNQKTVLIKIKL